MERAGTLAQGHVLRVRASLQTHVVLQSAPLTLCSTGFLLFLVYTATLPFL